MMSRHLAVEGGAERRADTIRYTDHATTHTFAQQQKESFQSRLRCVSPAATLPVIHHAEVFLLGSPCAFHLVLCFLTSTFSSSPPPFPPSRPKARWMLLTSGPVNLSSSPNLSLSPERIQSLAPTNFAHASVLNDLGLSMGAPTARSMISCGNTPSARLTPNRTV